MLVGETSLGNKGVSRTREANGISDGALREDRTALESGTIVRGDRKSAATRVARQSSADVESAKR